MPSIDLIINNKVGLHARPAAQFAKEAGKYQASIRVSTPGRPEANAKSILGILSLGVEQGTIITVRAEGEDADQALAGLRSLCEANFGDPE